MRDCGFRRHVPRPSDNLIQQEVIREFSPGVIDIDELAEAIRLLLESAPTGKSDVRRGRGSDLLSPRRRATHVVGAETT
jgi:hypothetical protein